jgi:hypothetical protein
MSNPVQDILSHFRHEHLPPPLARVSQRIGDVARALAVSNDELASVNLLSAAVELSQSLPPGGELAEGISLLYEASLGLPGCIEVELASLALQTSVTEPENLHLYARLRLLLRAKDALVRAEVSRLKSEQAPGPALLPPGPVQTSAAEDPTRDDRRHGMERRAYTTESSPIPQADPWRVTPD